MNDLPSDFEAEHIYPAPLPPADEAENPVGIDEEYGDEPLDTKPLYQEQPDAIGTEPAGTQQLPAVKLTTNTAATLLVQASAQTPEPTELKQNQPAEQHLLDSPVNEATEAAEPASDTTGATPQETPEVITDNEAAFEPYRAQLRGIAEQLDGGVQSSNIPGHVDSGTSCHVYSTGDGNVLKVPRKTIFDPNTDKITGYGPVAPEIVQKNYIKPLEAGRGAKGLEQLTAYTETDGYGIVCKQAEGRHLYDLPNEAVNNIPPEHFDDLMRVCQEMVNRNLFPDFNLSNVYYNPSPADGSSAFTLIDYSLVSTENYPPPLAPDVATGFAHGLSSSVIDPLRGSYAQRLLPPVGRTFYASYKNAFGDEPARQLLALWRSENYIVPEDLR